MLILGCWIVGNPFQHNAWLSIFQHHI